MRKFIGLSLILALQITAFKSFASSSCETSPTSCYLNPIEIIYKDGADGPSCLKDIKKLVPSLKLLDPLLSASSYSALAFTDWGNVETIKKSDCVQSVFLRSFPDHFDRGIFFDDNDTRVSERNCYSIDIDSAKKRILDKDHKRLHYLNLLSVYSQNALIKIKANFSSGGEVFEYTLSPCTFDAYDSFRSKRCNVTLIEEYASNKSESYIEIDKYWKELGSDEGLISCSKEIVSSLTNSWNQFVNLADIKIMAKIAERGERLKTYGASDGSVLLSDSTHPIQPWSANISLPFLNSMVAQELCDLSIVELSRPQGAKSWVESLGGTWCPWGVEVLSLQCEGFPSIKNRKVIERLSIDSDPVLKRHCSQ